MVSPFFLELQKESPARMIMEMMRFMISHKKSQHLKDGKDNIDSQIRDINSRDN
jgi:hypothetical protein